MIVFDVEIEKAILGRSEAAIEGIEYCNGWRDFTGMGISVVTTYDIATHLTRVFLKEDLGALATYLYGKATAGFNTKRFDIPLLAAHDVEIANCGPHYDMLEEIWLALGLNPDKFNPRTHGGWGMDAVGQSTLGVSKTGHGALAPVWWQKGMRGKVVDYCLNDVWMEGQLLLHIIKHGWVRVPDAKLLDVGVSQLSVQRPGGVQYMYEAAPIPRPSSAMDEANADNPLNAKLYSDMFDKPSATGSGEVGPSVSPGGLGIIR